jgi:hypothetical protein
MAGIKQKKWCSLKISYFFLLKSGDFQVVPTKTADNTLQKIQLPSSCYHIHIKHAAPSIHRMGWFHTEMFQIPTSKAATLLIYESSTLAQPFNELLSELILHRKSHAIYAKHLCIQVHVHALQLFPHICNIHVWCNFRWTMALVGPDYFVAWNGFKIIILSFVAQKQDFFSLESLTLVFKIHIENICLESPKL